MKGRVRWGGLVLVLNMYVHTYLVGLNKKGEGNYYICIVCSILLILLYIQYEYIQYQVSFAKIIHVHTQGFNLNNKKA